MGMHKYRISELFEEPQIETKNTNFRSWKKGKSWMFASALVASIIGGGTTMMTGASNASADTVTPSTTEKVAQTSTDNVSATTSEVAVGSIVATSNAAMSNSTSESATTSDVSAASIVSSTVTPVIKSTAVGSSTVMPEIESSTASSVAETSAPAQPVSSTVSTLEETGSTETNSNASVVTNQVTKTPTLITKDITVNKGQSFRQSAGFVEATDSTGKAVKTSDISITGVVNSNIAGTYYVLYSFVDVNGTKVTGKAQVNVRDAIAPVTPISDSAKQNDIVSSAANVDAGMTLSSNAKNDSDNSAVQSLSSQVATAISNGDTSLASSAMVSFANTDAGKSFASNAVDMLNSAASSMNSLGSLMADSQVRDFKNKLSAAVASSDEALAKSLVTSFADTSQGAILMSMASSTSNVTSNSTISSMVAAASNMAKINKSAAADTSSAADSFMATSVGQALMSKANSIANIASNASAAAVSEFAQTSDGKAMISALASYASNAQYEAFNEAMSEAVAGSNVSLASSLASSFFATSLGSQFVSDMDEYEATDAYKAMAGALSSIQDNVTSSLRDSMTLAGLSLNPGDIVSGLKEGLSNANSIGFLGGITNAIWNGVSWLATNVNPIKLIPNLTKMGDVGYFLESLMGATVGATFYGSISTFVSGLGANLLAVVPASIASSLFGIIPIIGIEINVSHAAALGWIGGVAGIFGGALGTALGAYYGGTMSNGLSSEGYVNTITSGTTIGATIGAVALSFLNDWFVSYPLGNLVDGLLGILNGVIGILGLGPIVNNLYNLVGVWFTPFTDTLASVIGAPIGALIGGVIGGGAGFLAQKFGLKFSIPDATQLVKDFAALPGISDLLTIIKEVTAKTGTVLTKAVTVAKGGVFRLISGFDKATDSNGKDVSATLISAAGSVNTEIPGVYIVDYSYPDSGTNTIVHGYSQVTVTA